MQYVRTYIHMYWINKYIRTCMYVHTMQSLQYTLQGVRYHWFVLCHCAAKKQTHSEEHFQVLTGRLQNTDVHTHIVMYVRTYVHSTVHHNVHTLYACNASRFFPYKSFWKRRHAGPTCLKIPGENTAYVHITKHAYTICTLVWTCLYVCTRDRTYNNHMYAYIFMYVCINMA